MNYPDGQEVRVGDHVILRGRIKKLWDQKVEVLMSGPLRDEDWFMYEYPDALQLEHRAEPPCVEFGEALAAFKAGKLVRRKSWVLKDHFYNSSEYPSISWDAVFADDWQIYEPEAK